jgi:BirA family biotin operon repressor/biotin-[acetyl-CoA-carboxylase] ligase
MNELILELFGEDRDQFVSGAQISEKLGCSRTAIWKHIESLRKEGYRFEAVPRKGYRLLARPDKLDAASVLTKLDTRHLGRHLHLYDQVESTQTILHQMAEQGAPEGTLVIAEQQLSGRGRYGRKWHSPKGTGIWMSLLLRPNIPLPFVTQLTLLSAVALCRTLRQSAGVDAGIKWPNDLLIGGKKVCGILLESSAENEQLRYVVAGIGISANIAGDEFPPELQGIATSLLAESGRRQDRSAIVATFLQQFEELYTMYQQMGFTPIRLLWEALTVTLGHKVSCRTPQGTVEGFAESIDENGAMVVRLASGERTRVYSADVERR